MRLANYGRAGLLVELDSLDEALRLAVALDRRKPAGVTELIPGARTVLIRFDPAVSSPAVLATEVTEAIQRAESAEPAEHPEPAEHSEPVGHSEPTERAEPAGTPGPSGAASTELGWDGGQQRSPFEDEVVEIPVIYDGADLAEVAEITGLSMAEVIDRHRRASYRVAFTGFAPGFGYLSGGDPALVVPRRSTPRTRVQAGAVGLAGEFTGVYPRPGPGGWQIIGRTELVMWDLERVPAALLRPGVKVRFREVSS
jgi:KipI family sensor histidine kinase inhibitor